MEEWVDEHVSALKQEMDTESLIYELNGIICDLPEECGDLKGCFKNKLEEISDETKRCKRCGKELLAMYYDEMHTELDYPTSETMFDCWYCDECNEGYDLS